MERVGRRVEGLGIHLAGQPCDPALVRECSDIIVQGMTKATALEAAVHHYAIDVAEVGGAGV